MDQNKSKNALVIRPGSIGDLILTVPVFISLQKNNFDVYLIGNEKVNGFFEERRIIKKGIAFGDVRLTEFFTKIKKILIPDFPEFDLVLSYIEENSIFSQNLDITFGKKVIFYPLKEEPECHMTEYILQPLKSIGIKVYYPETDKKNFNDILFIHPGSGSKKKNWPKENFLKIYHHFSSKIECKLILGECEMDNYEYWEKNVGKQNLILPKNISELSHKLEIGSYFIGNDSGVSHLAAFLGLEAFIIFGPTDPKIWAPTYKNVRIIKTSIDCSPCDRAKRDKCIDIICLKKIAAQDIIHLLENEMGR